MQPLQELSNQDLSKADIFYALYTQAKVTPSGRSHPLAGKPICNQKDAQTLYDSLCHDNYCDTVRGKFMPVGFERWPKIDIVTYDHHYGKGSAAKAIEQFRKNGYKPNDCTPCQLIRHVSASETIVRFE